MASIAPQDTRTDGAPRSLRDRMHTSDLRERIHPGDLRQRLHTGGARTRFDGSARSDRNSHQPPVGELLGNVTTDLQHLFRQEVELAKAEVKQEATQAGKAAGMLGGAGFAGYMVLIFGSLAAVMGLANVMDWGWAALVVTGVWALAAAVMALAGRSKMRKVHAKPERTLESLKEDAKWARHPTG